MSTEPQIKYESPYSSEPPPYNPDPNALKRRYSETVNNGLDSEEKRQRVEDHQSFNDDLDFAAMIASAAAAATQEPAPVHHEYQHQQQQTHDAGNNPYGAPVQNHPPHQQPDYNSQLQPQQQAPPPANIGFSSDPHLYMRICSLPILESLVSFRSTLSHGSVTNKYIVYSNTSYSGEGTLRGNY